VLPLGVKQEFTVSIPHRYDKPNDIRTPDMDIIMFQFLIGTINPKDAVRKYGIKIKFQFLIGTINPVVEIERDLLDPGFNSS